MTLLDLQGFDNDRLPNGFAVETAGPTVSFVAGRTGGRACQVLDNGATGPFANLVWDFLTNGGTERTCAFGIKFIAPTVPVGSTVFELRESSGSKHLLVKWDAVQKLALYDAAGTTLLATSTVAVDLMQWQHFGVHLKVADAGGLCEIFLNGSLILSYAGDTKGGGTNFTQIKWTHGNNGGGAALVVDDCYLLDPSGAAPYNAYLGDCKIQTLLPTGNGAASDWVGSDGNSVDNYQLVDDNGVTTDYVTTTAAGTRDLYDLTDAIATDVGAILAVQTEFYVSKSDSGDPAGQLYAARRSALGTLDKRLAASVPQISTAWQWVQTTPATTDPDGNTWNAARVNGLQVGPELNA